MAKYDIWNVDGDAVVYPVNHAGKVLRGRPIARFYGGGALHTYPAYQNAELFIRALELADAGAPIGEDLD